MPTRFWTPEEDAVLREHYGRERYEAIGSRLGRSAMGVRQRAGRLGVVRRNPGPRVSWTPRRLAVLRTLYGTLPSADLAAQLGCTVDALFQAAADHGIDRDETRRQAWANAVATAHRLRALLAWARGTFTGAQAAGVIGCREADLHKLAMREIGPVAREVAGKGRAA